MLLDVGEGFGVVGVRVVFLLPDADPGYFVPARRNQDEFVPESLLPLEEWNNLLFEYAIELRQAIGLQLHRNVSSKHRTSLRFSPYGGGDFTGSAQSGRSRLKPRTGGKLALPVAGKRSPPTEVGRNRLSSLGGCYANRMKACAADVNKNQQFFLGRSKPIREAAR